MKYIGNEDILSQIKISLMSAQKRNDAMPHMLFSGAAGCGKTTLAQEVTKIAGYKIIPVLPEAVSTHNGTLEVMECADDSGYDDHGNRIGAICPSIIFIDEIHRLDSKSQEMLGISMENFYIESERRGRVYWLPRFTLIGATTDDGLLTKPFRDRFKFRFSFKTYNDSEIDQIIRVHAERLKINITSEAIKSITCRGRGVPRIVVGYLERCRDMAISHDYDIITTECVEEKFKQIHIDVAGLNEVEVEILRALYEERTTIGLESLSIRVGENVKTIRNSVEPFLIQKGLIIISGRGRRITESGIAHLEKNGYMGRKKILKVDIPIEYRRA
jgi:Holliday junction DNA helicase RuvB